LALQKFHNQPTHHPHSLQIFNTHRDTSLPKMPQNNIPRNVYVYDSNVPQGAPSVLVAGFWQFGRTTDGEFYFNLEFCFVQPPPSNFRLMDSNGIILPRDGSIVPIGVYYVVSACIPLHVFHSNDQWIPHSTYLFF
jgi:hypothetical protein